MSLKTVILAIGLGVVCSLPTVALEGDSRSDTSVGVNVGEQSRFAKLAPAQEIETAAAQQYARLLQDARAHRALAAASHPLAVRVTTIAQKLIPLTEPWNKRARTWRWEVNVIGSNTLNAFCMPGGKIAVYSGLIQQLHLTDAELAVVMGHEMAHALREHAREQMGKSVITNGAARVGGLVLSGVLGVDPRLTDWFAREGAQLLELKFSRNDETEADLVGLELAARAGYDPHASLSLWQKMSQFNAQSPPQWLSTHPANSERIKNLERNIPKVLPFYMQAQRQREAPRGEQGLVKE
jgi:predicted Zn-dependent protease